MCSELALFWQHAGKNWGVEFKYADAPKMTRSMGVVLQDLDLERVWVVYPGREVYQLDRRVTVLPLTQIPETWSY